MGVSIREFARRMGASDTAVRKAIKAGRISKEADGSIDPVTAAGDWRRNTDPAKQRKKHAPSPPSNDGPFEGEKLPDWMGGGPVPDYAQSRALREAIAAKRDEMELLKKTGRLVQADKVERAVATLARVARDNLLKTPERLAPMVMAETDEGVIRALIQDEIEVALNELCAGGFAADVCQ